MINFEEDLKRARERDKKVIQTNLPSPTLKIGKTYGAEDFPSVPKPIPHYQPTEQDYNDFATTYQPFTSVPLDLPKTQFDKDMEEILKKKGIPMPGQEKASMLDNYVAAVDPALKLRKTGEGIKEIAKKAFTGKTAEKPKSQIIADFQARQGQDFVKNTGHPVVGNVALGLGNLASDAVTASALGIGLTPLLATTGGIDTTAEDIAEGKNLLPSALHGAAAGGITYATEGLGGIGKTKLGTKVTDSIFNLPPVKAFVTKYGAKAAKLLEHAPARILKEIASNAASEGFEEGLEYPLQLMAKNIIFKEHAPADEKEWAYNVLMGAAVGGLAGAPISVANDYRARRAKADAKTSAEPNFETLPPVEERQTVNTPIGLPEKANVNQSPLYVDPKGVAVDEEYFNSHDLTDYEPVAEKTRPVYADEAKKEANNLLRYYYSKADKAEITNDIQELYQFMADNNNDVNTYDAAVVKARKIAEKIINASEVKADEAYNEYEPLRDYIRKARFEISEREAHDFPDYEAWRKKHAGHFSVKKGNTNVDKIYRELAELYPNIFKPDEHIVPSDQLNHIAEVMDAIYARDVRNPFENEAEARKEIDYLADKLVGHFGNTKAAQGIAKDYNSPNREHKRIPSNPSQYGHKGVFVESKAGQGTTYSSAEIDELVAKAKQSKNNVTKEAQKAPNNVTETTAEESPTVPKHKDAGFKKELGNKAHDKISRRKAKQLDTVGKALGIKIEVVDQIAGGNANGDYHNGVMQIAADAEDPLKVVLSHESTHRLQELVPDLYEEYKAYAVERAIEREGKNAIENERIFYQESLQKAENARAKAEGREPREIIFTAEQAKDELAAEYAEKMMGETDLFKELTATNRTAAEKLLDFLESAIEKIKKYVKNLSLSSEERAEMRKEVEQLQKGADLWKNVLLDGTEQAKTLDTSTKAEPKQAQLSLKKNSNGKGLSKEQQEYFKNSKVVDENGNLRVVYHQTANDFTIFEPKRKGAGTSDSGTPFGIFLKSSDKDIGLNGKKQMPLYANITNPLIATDRADLSWQLSRIAPSFKTATQAQANLDAEYSQKVEDAKNEMVNFITDWRKAHPNASRSALWEVPEFNEVFEKENKLIEEWGKKADNISIEAKEAINQALEAEGYDGIILKKDKGSWGRQTDAYIALHPEQVKNIDNLNPTENPDIRYSVKGAKENHEDNATYYREQTRQNVEDYGAIPKGENPARDVNTPKRTTEDKREKVSQTVRTIKEAKATPETILPTLEDLTNDGTFNYKVYTDEAAIKDAEEQIKRNYDDALADWLKKVGRGEVSKKNTTLGWLLYNGAANSGNADTALLILENLIAHQRNAAQAVQATRVLKKLSPEAQLYYATKTIESLEKDIKERLGKDIDIKLNEEYAREFLEAKSQAAKDKAMEKLYKDVGRQVPADWLTKWNTWRYLAMLGNPRTHIRNFVGNAGFMPIVIAKDITGTALESIAYKLSGGKFERTKAFISPKDKALVKSAWNDFVNVQAEALGEGKYSDQQMANKYIQEGQEVFTGIFKPINKAAKANSKLLDMGDKWFSQPHYAFALAQYCKANGITPEMIAQGKGIDKARAYAIKEAQKATYRDTNQFSAAVSKLGRRGNAKTATEKLGRAVMEGILPFRKTPANILVRGVEYSPAGFITTIAKATKGLKSGKMDVAEVMDSLSANLTGTGLLALGMYLASQGLLRGGGSDDEKENNFNKLLGFQDYALTLPDGSNYTLDWLAPEVLPVLVGANLYESSAGFNEMLPKDLYNAVAKVSEPYLEMSMLSGLNSALAGIRYTLEGAPFKAVINSLISYIQQGIPTLGGQIERTAQDKRYTTHIDKNNSYLENELQRAVGRASAKIPGWDYQQIPYIDAWGRTEEEPGTAKRAFNNMLNPSYTSKGSTDKMEKELLRLNESIGDSNIFPKRAETSFTVDGKQIDLTGNQFVKYATAKGRTSQELVTALVNTAAYKNAGDEEKAELVKEMYAFANAQAKALVSSYDGGIYKKAITTIKETKIKPVTYLAIKELTSKVDGKDSSGETVKNLESLRKMDIIYSFEGLNQAQRQAIYNDLGISKTVQRYTKDQVKQALKREGQPKLKPLKKLNKLPK